MQKQLDTKYFLFGVLNAFGNKLQVVGDAFFEEISSKQWFALACISLCEEPPTVNQVAEIMGCSHQNLKQILMKLEKLGFIVFKQDESDKRKLRIEFTEQVDLLNHKYEAASAKFLDSLYEDIQEEELVITLRTLQKMEQNLDVIRRG